ncbi:MAG: hypothetical protein RLY11_793 [Bacteroidota bacterium]|jgi:hypothetical protein|nr:hypothetical protein [Chitinophagia bacterium]
MSYSEDEKKFIAYWEENRLKEKKFISQLMYGLPIGIIFSVPILVNFLLGKFWYKRADAVGISQFSPTVLIVAVILITVFIALLNRKLRWEKLEQQYIALKKRTTSDKS